ncbi:MAG: TldD/PmbA family protein [Pseudomonadota bacterium]
MTLDTADLPPALIEAALKAGADAADAIAVVSSDIGVSVREGALEEAEGSDSVDYGLRVLIGQRQACVSASDPAAIEELAARAVAMAEAAPEDPYCGLADTEDLYQGDAPDLELCDPSDPPSPEDLKALALRAEDAALSVDGVAQVESAGAGARRSHLFIAASNGFAGNYARTGASISVSAVAGEGLGMETDYDFASRIWASDLPDPADIGARAGQRAAERLNPRKAKTGAYPVLFDERISGGLVGHIMAAISGAAVARGASWLKDAMGEQVLPGDLDILDDPFRKRASGSRPFDGEGMSIGPRKLVENGVLMGWRMDTAAARQLGLKAPGGARRGLGGPPSPGMSNLSLTQGQRTREDLIREMGEGLVVTSLIGSSINPTTGAYSRGASGFWVEGGEIAYPVNELTIAGSLPAFLKTMIPANDADMSKSLISPSVLVEGLTVASG